MAFVVGSGASLQFGKETTFGAGATMTHVADMTSEAIAVSVEKGDEGSLLASKTAMSRDLLGISVDGSFSGVLRPEMAGLLFKALMGGADTVTASGSLHKHSIVLADTHASLPSLTVVVDRKSSVKKYCGVTVGSASFECNAGDYVTFTVNIKGTKEETGVLASGLNFTVPAYRCTSASLKINGTATDVSSCSFTIDNALEDAPKTYESGLYKGQPQHGQRAVTLSFSLPKTAQADAFITTYVLTETNASMELTFTSTSTDYSVVVKMPNVAFTSGSGNVSGAGALSDSFEGTALSVGATEPITVEIIDNTATAY